MYQVLTGLNTEVTAAAASGCTWNKMELILLKNFIEVDSLFERIKRQTIYENYIISTGSFVMKKFKLKKGDQVMVITGKDKGKSGEILEIYRSQDKVKVSGVNIVKKHRKPSQETPGKIDEIELPVHISNVSILDPKTGKPTGQVFGGL